MYVYSHTQIQIFTYIHTPKYLQIEREREIINVLSEQIRRWGYGLYVAGMFRRETNIPAWC